ncbi:MAG: hypothetical protein A2X45_17215 [Lentisphaerae bacterium GWF2_50_93]|nr:MAG: hypothetical protein A2X45_17215 [Lentisphaerae bacterium GWF2_50_93]
MVYHENCRRLMTKKEEYLYRALKEDIASLPSRTKLLTVREIMRRYSLSQGIVDRVLKALKDENLVVSFVGDGMYTTGGEDASSVPDRKKNVAIIVPDYPSSHFHMLTKNLKSTAELRGFRYKVIYVHQETCLKDCVRPMEFDAAVILPKKMPVDKEDIMFVKTLSFPVVFLEANTEVINIDSVGTDDEYCGALAANHFISSGHRKIAVLNPEPLVPVIQARVSGFIKQAKLSGIGDVKVFDCNTDLGESASVKAYMKMEEIIRGGRLDFTGLFVLSDSPALGVIRILLDNKIQIPSDLAIIGCDNIPESAFFSPALTTVDRKLDRWAEIAFEIINKRLEGDSSPVRHVNTVPELIARESTCAATASGKKEARMAS